MKKTFRALSLLFVASMMLFALAACGADKPAAGTTPPASDKTYTIGICQLVQHVALDAATQGFKDALTEQLGDAVTFEEKNAQGDSNTCSTICGEGILCT